MKNITHHHRRGMVHRNQTPQFRSAMSCRMSAFWARRRAQGLFVPGGNLEWLSRQSREALEAYRALRLQRDLRARGWECQLCGHDADSCQDPSEPCPKCNRIAWERHRVPPLEATAA